MNCSLFSVRSFALSAALIVGLPFVCATSAAAQSVTVIVAGHPLYLNPGPIEKAGRVFVPLRSIFERLGATVVYSAGTINATKGRQTISLQIGSTQATVNGQQQYVDVAPFIVGATTYVPLRFVAQSFGANVGYDASTRVVSIGVGHMPPYTPVRPNPPPMPVPPTNIVYLAAQQPAPNTNVANRFVVIAAQFTHAVRPDSVGVWLDGNDITYRSNISARSFSYKPPAPLAFGVHTVRVAGVGIDTLRFDRSWSFRTAGSPPPPVNPIDLQAIHPARGTSVSNRFVVISAEFTREADAGSVRVWLDGNNITGRSGVSRTGFSYKPPAPLDYGSHTVRVAGNGPSGLGFDRSWSFTVVRGPAPAIHLTINQPSANAAVAQTFAIKGNTVANGRIAVTAGAGATAIGQFSGNTTAGPLGNFAIKVTLGALPGQQAVRVRITATDPVTSQTTTTILQLRLNQ